VSVLSANTARPQFLGTTSAGSWNDLQGSVSEGAAGAALTFAAFRDTPFKLASFRDAQSDELHMTFQMSHGWKPGTPVRPHIHVIPLAAATGTVRLTGYYAWALYGQETPALVGWTAFTVDHSILAAEVNKLDILALADITPPDSAAESDCLLVYVKRDGGAGADTYAGNLAVVSLDCHYQIEKDGTDAEFPGA
jgi:hypothetical protein